MTHLQIARNMKGEVMSECREAFERNECEKYGNNYDDMKKNWDWYESQYGWRYPEDSPRGLEWKAWDKAWQHQQSKVDELKKQLIDQGQRFNEQAQRVKDLEHKNDELQKRINDSQDIIESILVRSLDNPEIQDLCGQLIDVLEKGIKGGDHEA